MLACRNAEDCVLEMVECARSALTVSGDQEIMRPSLRVGLLGDTLSLQERCNRHCTFQGTRGERKFYH